MFTNTGLHLIQLLCQEECLDVLKGSVRSFLPSLPFPCSLMAESEASWVNDKGLSSSPTATSPETLREPQWADNVVPPSHKGRTLIVCFDGTGDKFDADVSPIDLWPCPTRNS